MKIITAPTFGHVYPDQISIFVAGGITNCPDWQDDMLYLLKDLPDTVVAFNPRRANYPKFDPSVTTQQIEWEYVALNAANLILFWFPEETVCPITLYELGRHLALNNSKICIGCHPNYAKLEDVRIQSRLSGFSGRVHLDLDHLAKDVIASTQHLTEQFRMW